MVIARTGGENLVAIGSLPLLFAPLKKKKNTNLWRLMHIIPAICNTIVWVKREVRDETWVGNLNTSCTHFTYKFYRNFNWVYNSSSMESRFDFDSLLVVS